MITVASEFRCQLISIRFSSSVDRVALDVLGEADGAGRIVASVWDGLTIGNSEWDYYEPGKCYVPTYFTSACSICRLKRDALHPDFGLRAKMGEK
jgi:hypothetical protein